MNESLGLSCPICHIGEVTVIKSTLTSDEPKNRCDYCNAIITFYLKDEEGILDE